MWVAPQMDLKGTYWYPPGTIVTAKTPLAPFRVPGTSRFYNSDDMRSWRSLGYEWAPACLPASLPARACWAAAAPGPCSRTLRGGSGAPAALVAACRTHRHALPCTAPAGMMHWRTSI